MGPVQMLLIGFRDFQATGGIADELRALSDAGTIRVLDARFLAKDDDGDLIALRASDLSDDERTDLRAAVGALMGLGAGYVLGGEEGAAVGLVEGAEAGASIGDDGFSDDEIADLGADLEPGDAVLLLVIENCWAEGLRDAIRMAGATGFEQHYVTPEGLVALGALLGAAAQEG